MARPIDFEQLSARAALEKNYRFSPNASKADGYFNTKPAPPPKPPLPKDISYRSEAGYRWQRIEQGYTTVQPVKDNPGFRNAANTVGDRITRSPSTPSGVNGSPIRPPNPIGTMANNAMGRMRTASSQVLAPAGRALGPIAKTLAPVGKALAPIAKIVGPISIIPSLVDALKDVFDDPTQKIFDEARRKRQERKNRNTNIPDFNPRDRPPGDIPPFRGGNIAGKRYTVFFTVRGRRTYTNPSTGDKFTEDVDAGTGRAEGLIGPLGGLEVVGEAYVSVFGDQYVTSSLYITQAYGTPGANRSLIYTISALDGIAQVGSWAVPADGSTDDAVNPNGQSSPPEWEPPKASEDYPIFVVPGNGMPDFNIPPRLPDAPGQTPQTDRPEAPDRNRERKLAPLPTPADQNPVSPAPTPITPPQSINPLQNPPSWQPNPGRQTGRQTGTSTPSSQWSDPSFPGPYTITKTEIGKETKETKEPEKTFAPLPIPPIFPRPTDPDGNFDRPRQEEEQRRQDASKPLPQPKPRCQNSCSAGLEMGQEQINGKLDGLAGKIGAGISAADMASNLFLLNQINSKLGDQLPGGIAGKLTRLSQWLHLDRILNVLTYVNTLHNAYMLSNGLTQTLFSMISNVLAAVGIKDAENNPLDVGAIIGKSVDAFAKSVLGVETVDGIKAEWKKYSRIYQAASNLLWSIQSIGQSILGALEIVGSMVAKIGNALRKWGAISEKAFGWMNQTPNYQNRFFTALEKAEEVTSNIDSIAGEVLSIQDTITQIRTQKTELEKALKQDEGTKQGKESPEANELKKSEEKAKNDSKPPTIPPEAERKPEA
ncbi:hypothetical protein ACKFKH_32400 [Phormidesmis sp. 146-20]